MVQPVTQASFVTRVQDWIKQTPFVTRWLLLVNVAIYVLVLLFGFDFSYVCNNPASVFYRYHVFRWFTAPFFHVGILHIVFNMMAFHPMGSSLERITGSFNFLYLQLLFMLVAGVVDFILAVLLVWPVTIWAMPFMECGVGYSGIIFGMVVVESHHSQSEYRSIFGFFNVPTKFYPWAMLIVLQLLAQGVSFMGHLSGMLAGYLYVYRLLDVFVLPPVLANKMDTTFFGSRQGWITNPGYAGSQSLRSQRQQQAAASLFQGALARLSGALRRGSGGAAPHFSGSGTASRYERLPDAPPEDGGRAQAPGPLPQVVVAGARAGEGLGAVPAGEARALPALQANAAAFEAGVVTLVEMGFERPLAVQALAAAGGDVDMALEIIAQADDASPA